MAILEFHAILPIFETMKSSRRPPVVNIARNFEEAEAWDIEQQVSMTPAERQDVARELKRRIYGDDTPDVRDKQE